VAPCLEHEPGTVKRGIHLSPRLLFFCVGMASSCRRQNAPDGLVGHPIASGHLPQRLALRHALHDTRPLRTRNFEWRLRRIHMRVFRWYTLYSSKKQRGEWYPFQWRQRIRLPSVPSSLLSAQSPSGPSRNRRFDHLALLPPLQSLSPDASRLSLRSRIRPLRFRT
jgi:hypothetical protein